MTGKQSEISVVGIGFCSLSCYGKWESQNNSWPLRHVMTSDFRDTIASLKNVPGVYSFWKGNDILYIGRSRKMGNRILSSFNRCFGHRDEEITLRYIETKTVSDAILLEVYFIGKMKPPLNTEGNHRDELTLSIRGLPSFRPGVVCNVTKHSEA